MCRHLPCCGCHPELYTRDLLAMEHYSPRPISMAYHTRPVKEGGRDPDTAPLCPTCYEKAQRRNRRSYADVAQLLYRDMEHNR